MNTICPRCGFQWPVGNYHGCATHINPAAANPINVVIYPGTNACAAPPPIVWYPVLMS